jgi:hypothetical protein
MPRLWPLDSGFRRNDGGRGCRLNLTLHPLPITRCLESLRGLKHRRFVEFAPDQHQPHGQPVHHAAGQGDGGVAGGAGLAEVVDPLGGGSGTFLDAPVCLEKQSLEPDPRFGPLWNIPGISVHVYPGITQGTVSELRVVPKGKWLQQRGMALPGGGVAGLPLYCRPRHRPPLPRQPPWHPPCLDSAKG